MNRNRVRKLIVIATVGVAIPLTAGGATARITPGDPVQAVDLVRPTVKPTIDRCPLERVGDQLVRCDVLTGNGTTAPLYIPEQ